MASQWKLRLLAHSLTAFGHAAVAAFRGSDWGIMRFSGFRCTKPRDRITGLEYSIRADTCWESDVEI